MSKNKKKKNNKKYKEEKKQKEQLEKDIQRLKKIKKEQETELSKSDIDQINLLLEKISGTNTNKITEPTIIRKRVFMIIRNLIFAFIGYYVIYFSMLGLFSSWFHFSPSYLSTILTIFISLYVVFGKRICALITRHTHHYLSIYNAYSVITILIFFGLDKAFSFIKIDGILAIICFYYISEIISTMARYYLMKYLPKKIRYR